MKRRTFIRSLGGAVAAAMMPFGFPRLDEPAVKVQFTESTVGVRAMLEQCSRIHVPRSSFNFDWVKDFKREPGRASIIVMKETDAKRFTEAFFFNKPISNS